MEQYVIWQKIEEALLRGQREIVYYDGLEKVVLRLDEPTPRTAEMMY